jgi:hypothetical protein
MFGLNSRYAQQPVLEGERADGLAVRYVLPRLLPPPEDKLIATLHRTADGDRLDLLAYRHLGAPTAWWMLAEASRAVHPHDLPGEPGDTLRIPVPDLGKPAG